MWGDTRRWFSLVSSLFIKKSMLRQKGGSILFAAGFLSRKLLGTGMCFLQHVCITYICLSQRWLADVCRGKTGYIILSPLNI